MSAVKNDFLSFLEENPFYFQSVLSGLSAISSSAKEAYSRISDLQEIVNSGNEYSDNISDTVNSIVGDVKRNIEWVLYDPSM